ncbi:10114_t:CDS:1, partial [Dentiscutata erythropus]
MYLSDWGKLEEREKSYKNKSKNKDIKIDILHDIWSKWASFAKCRCESVNWKIKNPAGVSLCYQISWLDKTRGDFVGEFIIFRDKKLNTLKNSTFNKLMYKMPYLVKTIKTSQWKNQEKLDNSSSIENIYIYSKIPNYKSMGNVDMTNMTSPSQYMVDVGKNIFSLVKDNDAKILSIPNFLMSELEPNYSDSEVSSELTNTFS